MQCLGVKLINHGQGTVMLVGRGAILSEMGRAGTSEVTVTWKQEEGPTCFEERQPTAEE